VFSLRVAPAIILKIVNHHIMKKSILSVFFLSLLFTGLSYAQTLKGKVTGQPLASANVATGNKGVTTDEQGNYDLTLPAGKHKIIFSSVGFESKTAEVTLQDGETKTLDITLAAGAS